MEAFLKVIGHEFCDITLILDGTPIQAHKVQCLCPFQSTFSAQQKKLKMCKFCSQVSRINHGSTFSNQGKVGKHTGKDRKFYPEYWKSNGILVSFYFYFFLIF